MITNIEAMADELADAQMEQERAIAARARIIGALDALIGAGYEIGRHDPKDPMDDWSEPSPDDADCYAALEVVHCGLVELMRELAEELSREHLLEVLSWLVRGSGKSHPFDHPCIRETYIADEPCTIVWFRRVPWAQYGEYITAAQDEQVPS